MTQQQPAAAPAAAIAVTASTAADATLTVTATPVTAAPAPLCFTTTMLAEIPYLRRFAEKLTRAGAIDADDLVQDTLRLAWQKRALFDGQNAGAWLCTICRNRFYDLMRRCKLANEEPLDEIPGHDNLRYSPAGQDQHVMLREISAALRRIPQEQARAVLSMAIEGLTYEAIAARDGIAVGTVRSRLFRGRRALEAALEGHIVPGWLARLRVGAARQAGLGAARQAGVA